MGLLDYYRQFTSLSEEEHAAQLREVAAERRAKALAQVETLDLSVLTWPDMPPAPVVSAVTYVARRALNRQADARAAELRTALAQRLRVDVEQVVVGDGASGLIGEALRVLVEPGDEVVLPWPSWPGAVLAARHARGKAVPVEGPRTPESLLRAVNDRTRVVFVANPDDPTGALWSRDELLELADELPERVALLVDEALVEFTGAQGHEGAVALLDELPRLLVVRSFSKAWGLAGLRCGYAIGAPDAAPLLERLSPEQGVGDLTQAGALEALRTAEPVVASRVATVAAQRERIAGAARQLGFDVPSSRANTLWLGHPSVDGAELAARLERQKVRVATGAGRGDPSRVRAAVQNAPAADRLLRALELAV